MIERVYVLVGQNNLINFQTAVAACTKPENVDQMIKDNEWILDKHHVVELELFEAKRE